MNSLSANIMGNQYGAINPYVQQPSPYSQGIADMTTAFGAGHSIINGTGTVQIGPAGVSTSVPFAPGFSATPANTVNGLGLASPFATTSEALYGIGRNSFGNTNPYSPLINTPWDLNNGLVMATGAFGGVQNLMSPYAYSSVPQSFMADGSFGYGGPGGSQPGNFIDSNLVDGLAPTGGGVPYGIDPSFLGGGGMFPVSIDPSFLGGSVPVGAGQFLPGSGAALGLSSGNGDPFSNANLFTPVGQSTIPGLAQSFVHQGDDFSARYNAISDGISRLFVTGAADPNMPRNQWSSGSSLRSPFGIYETGVGWAGGNANAGLMGTQASGMAWAMVRNPINPGMIVSYSNPHYNHYNFNQGFTNA